MSKHTINHVFSDDEYTRRVENELAFYRSRDTTPRQRGAQVKISHSNATWFLQEVAEKVLAGFTLADNSPILTTYPEFSAFYVKPLSCQAEDIQAIQAEIKESYVAELKANHAAHVELLVAETLLAAERKEEASRIAKLTKLEAQARADALLALGEFDAA